MVKLIVGNTTFKVTPSYRAGARAHRKGTPHHENPYPPTDPDHHNWQAGYNNEASLLHVVDGVDLTAAEGHGTRVFSAPTWPEAEGFPKATRLRYALALMKASSMFEDAKIECTSSSKIRPIDFGLRWPIGATL